MVVLQQMVIFFILILVGLYARHNKMITEENQGQITQIVLRIAYPAIILSGAFTDEPHISNQQLLNTFGIVILLLVLLIIASWILPLILGYKKYQYGVVRAMNMFSNIGFMGVPLIAAIYGSVALIYMTVFLIPFNILFFSLGMKLSGAMAAVLP